VVDSTLKKFIFITKSKQNKILTIGISENYSLIVKYGCAT
jgi:hypothetical protein